MCIEILESLHLFLAQMGFHHEQNAVVRYRGFVLLKQPNQSWLVRPERSPMILLPFRTNKCSLPEVKAILDIRLSESESIDKAA